MHANMSRKLNQDQQINKLWKRPFCFRCNGIYKSHSFNMTGYHSQTWDIMIQQCIISEIMLIDFFFFKHGRSQSTIKSCKCRYYHAAAVNKTQLYSKGLVHPKLKLCVPRQLCVSPYSTKHFVPSFPPGIMGDGVGVTLFICANTAEIQHQEDP